MSLDTLIATGGLEGELVDLTIGPLEHQDGVKSEPLYEEAGIYIARQGHPRVKKKLTREAFNTERHVDMHLLLGKAGAGHRFVEEALASMGLVRNIAVVVPTFFAAACVVANTDYLSGMPLRVARSLRKSLGAIDDELGETWDAALRSNYVNELVLPRLSMNVSKGYLLPLDHSSLWFRAAAGSALGSHRNDPFARFYFGGFANNWVDHREIKQFRNTESFPGLDINEVGGASYGKAQVELTSPPLRFRSVGVPSLYLRWAALSLFGTGLVTDPEDASDRRSFGSVGAQVDLRLVTLSHLDSTLSLGWAVARGDGVPANSALMFSFKIM